MAENLEIVNVEQYRALLNVISDECLAFVIRAIENAMPDEHINDSTVYNMILQIAAKAICTICDNNQQNRKESIDFFYEALPKAVKTAVILRNSLINKNKH